MRKDGIFTGGAAVMCLCSMEKKLIVLFPIQNRFAKSHLILLQLKLSLGGFTSHAKTRFHGFIVVL